MTGRFPGGWARWLRPLIVVSIVSGLRALPAAAAEPTLTLSVSKARPGQQILLTLEGWPSPTTATVCGNAGLRASVDCALVGSVGVGRSDLGPERRQLTVTVPPAPCPCVVRASTSGEQLVRTAPIEIVGVRTAALVQPAPTDKASVKVAARLVGGSPSLAHRLQSALGGRTHRRLLLGITNTGSVALTDVTVTAAVARDTQGGEPLASPSIGQLAPGETRPFRLEVAISPPSFGSYVVFGTVYGAGQPVPFEVRTTTTPWLLYLLVLLTVVDVGAMLLLRARRRRALGGGVWPPAHANATSEQTEVEQPS